MTNKELNELRAKAEACAMGFTVEVKNKEECLHIINHLVYLINECEENEALANAIYDKAMELNSDNAPITHISIGRYGDLGTMLTLVRDKEMQSITDRNGVFAYIYNFNYPDCSELGYAYFRNENGKIRRIG